MDEDLWLSSGDPQRMIRFLARTDTPRLQDVASFPDAILSDRKFRLFAVACFRAVAPYSNNALAHEAVRGAERFADGLIDLAALTDIDRRLTVVLAVMAPEWRAASNAARRRMRADYEALTLALQLVRPHGPAAAYYASSNAYLALANLLNTDEASPTSRRSPAVEVTEKRRQAEVLRDIVGNPFRETVTVAPLVLAANDGAAVAVARAIYDDRDSSRLPILGDALEDGGCEDAGVLAHCRDGGGHARGCWVVDLVLRKG